MRLIDDNTLTPSQAVARFCRWREGGPSGGLAVFVGDWAALDAAERTLIEKGFGVSFHVLSVNHALLEGLPQAAELVAAETGPSGREQVQRAFDRAKQTATYRAEARTWGREQVRSALNARWTGLLRALPCTADVLVLKHFELVVAYQLDWAGVTQRAAAQAVLLLLPGDQREEGIVAYPRPGLAGQPWPPELTPDESTWIVSSQQSAVSGQQSARTPDPDR
jgi:hypothetical protein